MARPRTGRGSGIGLIECEMGSRGIQTQVVDVVPPSRPNTSGSSSSSSSHWLLLVVGIVLLDECDCYCYCEL